MIPFGAGLALQDAGSVKHKVILLFYVFPETQMKMDFYSYHQDAQDKVIRVPRSVKVSYLLALLVKVIFSWAPFWMCSKQGSFVLSNIISSLSHIAK